jgi:ribosomal protein S18 acetylase RimI-like enzyme
MIFEPITENSIEIALEIVNSNPTYNILENGTPLRSLNEVNSEFLNTFSVSYLIKQKNRNIGIIDFLKKNPRDNHPWIGLLMIKGDYHSLGYGKKAYASFEEKLKQQQFNNIHIGVLQNNLKAIEFWKSLGFKFYGNSEWQGKVVYCFEKQII